MKYHYRRNIYEDIKNWLIENIDYNELITKKWDPDIEDELYEQMWADDSVTGNGSGSYTMNRWIAEEFLCHNLDLLEEALNEYEWDIDKLLDPETCDVIIRCYLLSECLSDVLWDIRHGEIEGWA